MSCKDLESKAERTILLPIPWLLQRRTKRKLLSVAIRRQLGTVMFSTITWDIQRPIRISILIRLSRRPVMCITTSPLSQIFLLIPSRWYSNLIEISWLSQILIRIIKSLTINIFLSWKL